MSRQPARFDPELVAGVVRRSGASGRGGVGGERGVYSCRCACSSSPSRCAWSSSSPDSRRRPSLTSAAAPAARLLVMQRSLEFERRNGLQPSTRPKPSAEPEQPAKTPERLGAAPKKVGPDGASSPPTTTIEEVSSDESEAEDDGSCEACKGKHRAHTCAKKGTVGKNAQRCNAQRWQERTVSEGATVKTEQKAATPDGAAVGGGAVEEFVGSLKSVSETSRNSEGVAKPVGEATVLQKSRQQKRKRGTVSAPSAADAGQEDHGPPPRVVSGPATADQIRRLTEQNESATGASMDLQKGQLIDALDKGNKNWYPAKIVESNFGKVDSIKVHFVGYKKTQDKLVMLPSQLHQIAASGSKTGRAVSADSITTKHSSSGRLPKQIKVAKASKAEGPVIHDTAEPDGSTVDVPDADHSWWSNIFVSYKEHGEIFDVEKEYLRRPPIELPRSVTERCPSCAESADRIYRNGSTQCALCSGARAAQHTVSKLGEAFSLPQVLADIKAGTRNLSYRKCLYCKDMVAAHGFNFKHHQRICLRNLSSQSELSSMLVSSLQNGREMLPKRLSILRPTNNARVADLGEPSDGNGSSASDDSSAEEADAEDPATGGSSNTMNKKQRTFDRLADKLGSKMVQLPCNVDLLSTVFTPTVLQGLDTSEGHTQLKNSESDEVKFLDMKEEAASTVYSLGESVKVLAERHRLSMRSWNSEVTPTLHRYFATDASR